jgi:hypothetical protein
MRSVFNASHTEKHQGRRESATLAHFTMKVETFFAMGYRDINTEEFRTSLICAVQRDSSAELAEKTIQPESMSAGRGLPIK